MILRCQQPDECALRRERLQGYLARVLPRAEKDQETFLAGLGDGTSLLEVDEHLLQRQGQRAVNRDLVQEVIECGEPIEWFQIHDASGNLLPHFRLLLCAVAGEQQRPLHVAVRFGHRPKEGPWIWEVQTVYDPRTRTWQWSADYRQRLCFCASRPVRW
jgi:hypothetical protein